MLKAGLTTTNRRERRWSQTMQIFISILLVRIPHFYFSSVLKMCHPSILGTLCLQGRVTNTHELRMTMFFNRKVSELHDKI